MSKVVIVDEEFLDACGDQLKVVANVAVGYNNIDVHACERRGVVATNTPKVLTETTADTAFGLMLMVTRRFGEGERVIRSRTPWQWGMFYNLGMGLQGKTLGIVGMGQIGIAMARRAKVFGMEIVYSDAYELDADVAEELGARKVELDVFEAEPTVHEGLLDRDDVVLLPHLGSGTVETRTAMAELAAQNVLDVLAGKPPVTPVTKV
ncbi:NAD(P)-dependent oxidoreductase [Arsenicicoccus cauae]|uniref:NAD(P)-dependent oxidoreductase n=1 Tax=Arsenicicoccus cauae TaxID=2663847 RepID=UPI00370D0932